VVTGSPGSGKSSFVSALSVNLARRAGWQFLVFPAENLPIEEYISTLIELYAGKPFNTGYHERMSREEMLKAAGWVDDHFIVLNPPDGERDLDGLISIARAYVRRRGIRGLIVDPWNELEGRQPTHQTETQYICDSLIKIRQFSRNYAVHT